MRKKQTTVLFISNDNEHTKALHIPTKLIENYKKYLTAVSILIVAIITFGLIFFVNYNSQIAENEKLLSKMSDMKNDVALVDSLHIKDKINNIENRIFDIKEFLKERGLHSDTTSVGGAYYEDRHVDVTSYDFFDKYTSRIFDDIQKIPLGVPYNGEESSDYGYRSNPFGGRSFEFHSGKDFKGNTGDPIRVTADGTVVEANYKGGYGLAVVVEHAYGLTTLYGHLSGFNVQIGDKVNAGDVVGFLGSTGRSTGPHVHYEIRKNGVDIDPNQFLQL